MPDDLFTPPAITASAEDLSALAGEFKALDHEVEVGLRQNIDKMMKLGRIVLKFKAGCAPGTFEMQFQKTCPGKLRSAYRYLRVLSRRKEVQDADNLGDALRPYADALALPGEGETEGPSSDDPRRGDTVTPPTPCSAERETSKSGTGNEKPIQTGATGSSGTTSSDAPARSETPGERSKRKVSEILDRLADVNLDMDDLIGTPVGMQALAVAEELGLEVAKDFVGEEDRFGRASDTKGETRYYPKPVKELIQWWTTVLGRLEKPTEVDF